MLWCSIIVIIIIIIISARNVAGCCEAVCARTSLRRAPNVFLLYRGLPTPSIFHKLPNIPANDVFDIFFLKNKRILF
jgi:hypothetical protein